MRREVGTARQEPGGQERRAHPSRDGGQPRAARPDQEQEPDDPGLAECVELDRVRALGILRRAAVLRVGRRPAVAAETEQRMLLPLAWQFTVKYALDRILAGLALFLLSPLLAIFGLAVLVSMERPVFFRQVRVGRDGRSFEMLKFRSMRPSTAPGATLHVVSPDVLGPGGEEGAEDRRTRVGSFLRRSSLDELPQLINVLRGDMSLVGPRPERPEYVSEFQQTVYRYGDRHRVKAGITGWAQVHGLRGKTSLADRAEWDNTYIENFSLWLDLKVSLMTVAAVFGAYDTVE